MAHFSPWLSEFLLLTCIFYTISKLLARKLMEPELGIFFFLTLCVMSYLKIIQTQSEFLANGALAAIKFIDSESIIPAFYV